MEKSENKEKLERLTCDVCGKSFCGNSNLQRHKRSAHPKNNLYLIRCDICEFSTPRPDVLKKHKINKHEKAHLRAKVLCPICNIEGVHEFILSHFKKNHEIELADEIFNFSNELEFQAWKLDLERTEKNHFVVKNSWKTENGSKKVSYHCFRSGVYKLKCTKKRPKLLGSNKVNGLCPAKIDAEFKNDGSVKVVFQKTHVGHRSDVRRLRLSKSERDSIASKIALKIPFGEIIDTFRSSIKEEMTRENLICRKDLHNIKRDYKLVICKALEENPEHQLKLDQGEIEQPQNEPQEFVIVEQGGGDHQYFLQKSPTDIDIATDLDATQNVNAKKDTLLNEFMSLLNDVNSTQDLDLLQNMMCTAKTTLTCSQDFAPTATSEFTISEQGDLILSCAKLESQPISQLF